jgi:integrase
VRVHAGMLFLPENLRPVLALGYYCGMRLGEIQQLKWSGVDLKRGEITLQGNETKNGRPRAIPLILEVPEMLNIMRQKNPTAEYALSYNAQISADAAHGLIVGVAVTEEANDCAQLLPAVDRLEQRLNKRPQQMVADRGYTTRENIEKMARREIDFLGTMRYVPRRSQPTEPVSTERIPLSAGEGSLCLPGGQNPASAEDNARWGPG